MAEQQGIVNPLLYDMDRLREIASEPIIRRGIAYFKEHRVIQSEWLENRIYATVEGSDPDNPYFVEIALDEDGELLVDCSCPFAWEPVCKHAVATLLVYESENAAKESVTRNAAETAIADRAKRGRTEVRITHIAGKPAFGTWRAQSIASTFSRAYQVQIRSLEKRQNHCTCPDHAINLLGTCKHIEAVLHRLKKRAKGTKLQGPPQPFVYLRWDADHAPEIRVQRTSNANTDLEAVLERYFDAGGLIKGSLPESFFRFGEEVFGREDILVGDDAVGYARHLAEKAAHEVRARRIREEILRSGGQIDGVRARLYPYQVEGVAFLVSNGRALLADDMGLGKTLQSIAAAVRLMEREGVARTLIVCPASLKFQWAREIQKFTGLETQIIQGNPQTRLVQYRRQVPFTIINYELVLRDVEEINRLFAADLLIVDEAQRVKNWRTKIAGAVRLLTSRYLFVLTGTPLENRLEDLYSLIQLVDPRALGPLWRYFIDFHVTDDRGKVLGYRNLAVLRRRIAPVMLRRQRTIVKDQLPERIHQRIDVAMSLRQKRIHDAGLQNAQILVESARNRPLTPSEERRFLSHLQQARMACNAAGLVDKETEGSPKLDELAKLLEDLCLEHGRKAVVFSQWERMTAMAEKVARSLGLGTVRLHGGVPTKSRGALLDRFRNDESVQVFISTDAGGVGLNLQDAEVLINLDIPWNPAVLEQRIGRIHRLGQKQKVQILLLVAAESYEERVLELLLGKRVLFDNVVEPDGTEDVVGVSKRMLENFREALAEGNRNLGEKDAKAALPPGELPEVVPELAEPKAIEPEGNESRMAPQTEEDHHVRRLIARLQAALGPRLERILGAGGGILAVVDMLDWELEQRVEEIDGGEIPVALMDTGNYHQLQKLGKGSPLAEAEVLLSPERPAAPAPFAALSQRKLKGAEVLIEQQLFEEGLGLLADAMLAAVAVRAQMERVPSLQEAPIWLYGEAVSSGFVTAEEAASITKAVSFANAPQVPGELVTQVLQEARGLLARAVV